MKNQNYFVNVPAETTWMLPGFLTKKFAQTGGASYCQVYCRSKRCSLWHGATNETEGHENLMPGRCPLQNSAN
jgi:hypothetical protein